MNTQWLSKTYESSCIVFFNGWGMDSHAVQHLGTEGYDVCMVHNYTDFAEIPDVHEYKNVIIVAWSMGIWAANMYCNTYSISYSKAIAINGTGTPMHNEKGIPNDVFIATSEHWNENTRSRFNMRMCGGKKAYEELGAYMSKRPANEQKTELEAIHKKIIRSASPEPIKWNKAIIGENDLIFSSKNQKNYWLDTANSITLPLPHFPFHLFQTWKDVLEL